MTVDTEAERIAGTMLRSERDLLTRLHGALESLCTVQLGGRDTLASGMLVERGLICSDGLTELGYRVATVLRARKPV